MTPEQKAAFIIAQSVEAFGRIAGMMSANAAAAHVGQPPAYAEVHFISVAADMGLHHNALITFFQQ